MLEMSVEIVRAMMRERDRLYEWYTRFKSYLARAETDFKKSRIWAKFYRLNRIVYLLESCLDALDDAIDEVNKEWWEAKNESDN